jgi:hypothetical protein
VANVFLSLVVPAADGVGAWVDVSSQGPERRISVDGGAFGGTIYIEASNDGQASAAPANVGPFTGPTEAPQTFVQAYNFMRVRRAGSGGVGTPTVNLAAPAAVSNAFGAMNVPAVDGVGAAIDLSGGGDVNTFQVEGPYTGQVFIETSTDGVNFSPTLLFQIFHGPGQQVLGVLSAARVRRRGSSGGSLPLVSVGSQATSGAAGGAFPGYAAAPPKVAAASAGGASALVSRGDHTHGQDLTTYTPSLVAMQGTGLVAQVAFAAGIATFGLVAIPTSFPGFGGAPPAVASASAAGAAGTASRSDHTHAQDLSVVYAPSQAAGQASGVFQQTYAAPNATPSVLTMVAQQVPFGAASGLLQQSARLKFTDGVLPLLNLGDGTNTSAARVVFNLAAGAGAAIAQLLFQQSGANQSFIQASFDGTAVTGRNSIANIINTVAGGSLSDNWTIKNGTGTDPVVIAYTEKLDVAIGTPFGVGPTGVNGFVWLPITSGLMTSVPERLAVTPGPRTRLPIVIDDNDRNLQYYSAATSSWHFVTFDDYNATATRIPFGGATTHTLTDNAALTFTTATRLLTVGSGSVVAQQGSILVNSNLGGVSIGGGATAGIYIADPFGAGAASLAVDDYVFCQNVVGYSNLNFTNLAVGAAAGSVFSLSYNMDRVGGHTDVLTVDGTTGATAAGIGVTFRVGTVGAEGLQVLPNAAGSDTFVGFAGALAAGATHGYPYMPNVNATPTGAPAAFGAGVGAAFAYARNTNTLQIRDVANGVWQAIPAFATTLAPGAGVQVTTNLPAGFGLTPKWWNFQAGGTNNVIAYYTNP